MTSYKSRCIKARAFTLIEMVTSLAIISVLLLGLSSAVMISAHAIPTSTDIGLADQAVINAVNTLRADLREATSIQFRSNSSGAEIRIDIRDAGAEGTPGRILYTYTNSSDTVSRTVDALDEVVVVAGVQSFVFTTIDEGSKARVAYILMAVDDTIQSIYELHAALPYKPEVQ